MAQELNTFAVAEVEGTDYSFDIKASSEADAYKTANEHLDLIGMPDWKDKLILNFKEES